MIGDFLVLIFIVSFVGLMIYHARKCRAERIISEAELAYQDQQDHELYSER